LDCRRVPAVTIDGVSMTDPKQAQARQKLRRRIQMVFQDPYTKPQSALPGRCHRVGRSAFDLIRRAHQGACRRLLGLVGLHRTTA
jgi:peptide/nickel transport system ATP-binding protein